MASAVDIVNRALTKLGANTLIALTDDTPEGRVMNRMYEIVRDSELRAHVWQFSLTRASLAALVSTPLFDFTYQYQLPSDLVRLVEVSGHYHVGNLNNYITSTIPPYKVEGNKILTDYAAPLNIRYVARITDTSQYDTCFVEALACRLAAEACETLTQSTGKRQQAWTEYKQALHLAATSNALETPSDDRLDDSWIVGRL